MKNTPNHVRVWAWEDAPQELKDYCSQGGDEDWLALVPPKLVGRYIPWLEKLGVCDVTEYAHPELPGYTLHVGAHA